MVLPLTRNIAPQAITTNKIKSKTAPWVKSSFKLFSSVSSYNRKKLLKPHHTFIKDGYVNSGENGGFSGKLAKETPLVCGNEFTTTTLSLSMSLSLIAWL